MTKRRLSHPFQFEIIDPEHWKEIPCATSLRVACVPNDLLTFSTVLDALNSAWVWECFVGLRIAIPPIAKITMKDLLIFSVRDLAVSSDHFEFKLVPLAHRSISVGSSAQFEKTLVGVLHFLQDRLSNSLREKLSSENAAKIVKAAATQIHKNRKRFHLEFRGPTSACECRFEPRSVSPELTI